MGFSLAESLVGRPRARQRGLFGEAEHGQESAFGSHHLVRVQATYHFSDPRPPAGRYDVDHQVRGFAQAIRRSSREPRPGPRDVAEVGSEKHHDDRVRRIEQVALNDQSGAWLAVESAAERNRDDIAALQSGPSGGQYWIDSAKAISSSRLGEAAIR